MVFHWLIVPVKLIFARDVQLLNEMFAISVTLSGIVILVKLEQPIKAPAFIEVTPFGIMTVVNPEQNLKVW